ncbi:hypothetical protein BC833DRAFT_621724 [Globomyces pollinis-pini]|nr:hypothetical protein BC833DRAFT_621724 [Globomyces pollinis-pini]
MNNTTQQSVGYNQTVQVTGENDEASTTSSVSSNSTKLNNLFEPTLPLRSHSIKRKFSIESLFASYVSDSETEFDDFDSPKYHSLPRNLDKQHLTQFPQYGKPLSPRSYSVSDKMMIRRRTSIFDYDVIPIEFYRNGMHISVDLACSSSKHTVYVMNIRTLLKHDEFDLKIVQKRYSVFRKLYIGLMTLYPKQMRLAPPFPERSLLARFDPSIVGQRVEMLNEWMQFLVLDPDLCCCSLLKSFCEAN